VEHAPAEEGVRQLFSALEVMTTTGRSRAITLVARLVDDEAHPVELMEERSLGNSRSALSTSSIRTHHPIARGEGLAQRAVLDVARMSFTSRPKRESYRRWTVS